MKFKVCVGSVLWLMILSLLHIQLNVGWSKLGTNVQVALGNERPELVVGFLPVT